jgi:hypothetical protein
MEEHIVRNPDGTFKGVYVVNVAQHTENWDAVDEAIREYTQIHPMETQAIVVQNAAIRNSNYTKFGSNKGKTMRHGASLPPGLYFKLQQIMPDLFTNKRKLHHFMKVYKGFRTCDTV